MGAYWSAKIWGWVVCVAGSIGGDLGEGRKAEEDGMQSGCVSGEGRRHTVYLIR